MKWWEPQLRPEKDSVISWEQAGMVILTLLAYGVYKEKQKEGQQQQVCCYKLDCLINYPVNIIPNKFRPR